MCTSTKNVHDQMYIQLEAISPCVVRLNGSQSVGCTSFRDGNVGVVHLVYNSSDLDWVLNSAPMDSYIVVLNLDMFSFVNLKKFNDSSRINGVLLVQKSARENIPKFSPEDTCPNRYSGLAAPPKGQDVCEPQPWNPSTVYSRISMFKWSLPIFFTDDEQTIDEVETNFRKFNLPLETQKKRSLCALKMSAHMFASVDSTTCIRRNQMAYNFNPIRYCEPLGDVNIWAPVIPFSKTPEPKQKYIIVAARLDSTSLFYGQAPGALSTATSLVTLLNTAHLMFDMTLNTRRVEQNVLFVLFNGEAYDYIGSSRIVYDMEHGWFPFKEHPISLDDISLFIELSQLRNNKTVTYHSLKSPDSEMSTFVDKFIQKSTKYGFKVTPSSSNSHFPPASFQSFVAKRENMSGLVFSSFGNQFTNRFYHSLYDDALNVDYMYANGSHIEDDSLQSFVANFSTALAQSLYEIMTGQVGAKVADRELVDEMLHCYIDSISCKFGEDADFVVESSENEKPDYYVGVDSVYNRNQVTVLTRHAFIHLMSRNVTMWSKRGCIRYTKNFTHYTHSYWSDTSDRCVESATNISDAVSPAFTIADYNLAEGLYSSWTESSWQTIDLRMFLQPSPRYEWLVFVIGNTIVLTSFAALCWIQRNSDELFNHSQSVAASNI